MGFFPAVVEDAMSRAAWPLLLLAIAATGCTMCPDPFDYSGPVPNGSVTQNDFCARSNGILPLHATPSPWPPIVDGDDDRPEAESVVADYAGAVIVAGHVGGAAISGTATAAYPQAE
jgi:hypothetical protein